MRAPRRWVSPAVLLAALLIVPVLLREHHPDTVSSELVVGSHRMALQYPAGWRMEYEEGRTEPYQQIRLVGPRNEEDTYTAFIAIRVRPRRSEGGWYERVEELVSQSAEHVVEGSVVDGPRAVQVAGLAAEELLVSLTITPRPQHGLPPLPIPVQSRAVFFEREGAYYEIVYSADAREFARHEQALADLLESFPERATE